VESAKLFFFTALVVPGIATGVAVDRRRPSTLRKLRGAVIEGAVLRVWPRAMTAAGIIAGLLPVMPGGGIAMAPLVSMLTIPVYTRGGRAGNCPPPTRLSLAPRGRSTPGGTHCRCAGLIDRLAEQLVDLRGEDPPGLRANHQLTA